MSVATLCPRMVFVIPKERFFLRQALHFSRPIMEAINEKQDGWYCTDKEIPEKLKDAV